jgi:CTP:molybdopterin cytidylyltransferase MocA
MPPVTVLILSPGLPPGAGPLAARLDDARTALAEHHRRGFIAAGADEVVIRREPPDDTPFGARLRRLVAELQPAGLVVLGAGSIPLATPDDLAAFVEAAAVDEPGALANSFYSADAIAVACASISLQDVPADLGGDNTLPRWLAEVAGVPVRDLRDRRDLAVDIDSPLDLLLLESAVPGLPVPDDPDSGRVRTRLGALRELATNPSAELLVAGRVSADDLRRIERGTRARTRALVEERGLRTASLAAARGRPNTRPPRSLLARLLERDGPERLGEIVASVSDGALIDTRVLMAARSGADERAWPSPEDRFASDLLLVDRITDPWLRSLTAAAATAPVPILLGAHTLVGPGSVLALGIEP